MNNTYIEQRILLLQDALLKNVGVKSVTTDGTSIVMDRDQMIRELASLERQRAFARRGSGFRSINLGGAWGF